MSYFISSYPLLPWPSSLLSFLCLRLDVVQIRFFIDYERSFSSAIDANFMCSILNWNERGGDLALVLVLRHKKKSLDGCS